MIAPFDPATSAKLFVATFAVGALGARVLLPSIAKLRSARVAAGALLVLVGSTHVLWAFGPTWSVEYRAEVVSMFALCILPLLVASIPIAAILRLATRVALKQPEREPTVGRRAILTAATAVAPALAFGTGVSGFVSGARPPLLKRVRFEYPELPTDLVGLRILHLSDLHLGADKGVLDLTAFLDRLRDDVPDLVVFTGDVAEDPALLDPALAAAVALGPRLGVYASLGNHEYLEGIDRALAGYAKHRDVRLLVDEGECVRVGSSQLWIAGANDPVFVNADPVPFLDRCVKKAMASAPEGSFKLLMSHRPEGFVPAEARRVDLTLSGHTHGGQIGFNGKSAFERIWPEHYLWGKYSSRGSRLYTTSGFAHWFPFRVGCPAEAPVIELARA